MFVAGAFAGYFYAGLASHIDALPVPGVSTGDTVMRPVAAVAPGVKTAMQICSDPKSEHLKTPDGHFIARLTLTVLDDKGREIHDPAGALIQTRYWAIVSAGPQGVSSDVALFHSATSQFENPGSEPNTAAITNCIQKDAKPTQAVQ